MGWLVHHIKHNNVIHVEGSDVAYVANVGDMRVTKSGYLQPNINYQLFRVIICFILMALIYGSRWIFLEHSASFLKYGGWFDLVTLISMGMCLWLTVFYSFLFNFNMFGFVPGYGFIVIIHELLFRIHYWALLGIFVAASVSVIKNDMSKG